MLNENNPLVSICIPVYNCERFIEKTIESALAQTYTNIEIIIIDNASTDTTYEIISRFSNDRIKLIRNAHNIGLKNNWNKVIAEAEGKFIKLLPADDLIYPDCIEKEIRPFLNDGLINLALVCCGRNIIDSDGALLFKRSFNEFSGLVEGKRAIRAIIRSGTNRLGEPGAILFERERLIHQSGFDDTFPYVIDLNSWLKMLTTGNLYVVNEYLCGFRVSGSSESYTTRHDHSFDFSRYIKSLDKTLFGVNEVDILIGTASSYLLQCMRRLFYKISDLLKIFYGKE
jgi:glycosyltransferase involved in cell wall biosynthesis